MPQRFLWWGVIFATMILVVAKAFGQTSFTVRHTRVGGNFLWSIAAGPGTLVAVGDGGTILSSPDGANWTRRDSGTTDWLVGVTYGDGKFVAVGDNGRVLTSPDGTAWTRVPQSATTARLNNVIHRAGIFVAVGESGTILTSPDAASWTLRSPGVTASWLRGLGYKPLESMTPGSLGSTGGGFYAAGENGTLLFSADGVRWGAPLSLVPPGGMKDLEAATDWPAAIGADGTGYYLSIRTIASTAPVVVDGVSYLVVVYEPRWFRLDVGITARFRGLVQGANVLFATGENGIIASAPSPAGPWSRLESGTTDNLVGGAYVGNSLFVVGDHETILQSTPLYQSRLLNLSARGRVGIAGDILMSGLVVAGTQPKSFLLRAAGPALRAFGVTDALAAPILSVLDAAGRLIATNAGWGTNANPGAISTAASRASAFPFAAGSADSALLLTLAPGGYTLQVTGRDNATGVALIEAYDRDALGEGDTRAINLSTRAFVGGNGEPLITGVHIGGAAARRVLVRAVGPSLASFGVTGVLSQPVLEIYQGGSVPSFRAGGSWSAGSDADEIRASGIRSGAFALAEDSSDVALIATLAPGNSTAVVRGANNTSGIALVEVYDLP
jgi:hypothetical protein